MIKQIKINFSELYDPMQIMHIVKLAGFRSYAYCFTDNQERVLKYGIQYSSSKEQLGERVYRQAANLSGWGKPLPYSTSGMSMQRLVNDYKEKYNIELDRFSVSVMLWDQTDPALSASEMKAKCLRVESDLISKHINQFGVAPIGNNEKATRRKVSANNVKATVSELFD